MSTKLWAVAALSVSASALAFIVFGNLGENLVYYWTPTEMAQAGDKAEGATIRLGGLVETGSIRHEGDVLVFRVSDGTTGTTVRATEIPPAMFREGIGVVVEGTLADDGTFTSKRLMVKHDNQYQAPEGGAMPDKAAMFETISDAEPTP